MARCLADALQEWDGKSVEDILETYEQFHKEDGFVLTLFQSLSSESTQSAASWLIKYYLESGNHIVEVMLPLLYEHLGALKTWESRLHVLQILPKIYIPEEYVGQLERFVRASLEDQNKFVRAWAYQGLYELAQVDARYKQTATVLFEKALLDEAPSVKARVRKCLKGLKKA